MKTNNEIKEIAVQVNGKVRGTITIEKDENEIDTVNQKGCVLFLFGEDFFYQKSLNRVIFFLKRV